VRIALKYHPDRNPGREAEVNSKFQTIQSAHEVLTNPDQKSTYDAHRARVNRYPAASGVRGNPWQNVASQYPVPPKRSPTTARPPQHTAAASGASRYSSWFPPTQKSPRDNNGDHLRAWDRMRPASSGKPSTGAANVSGAGSAARKPKVPERQQPPRTQSQRKKADASFGTRRTAFVQSEDETPVNNRNYFTTNTHTNLFHEASSAAKKQQRPVSEQLDPLSQQFRETLLDPRQSTPYTKHSGEKTDLFDGANISRVRSAKEFHDSHAVDEDYADLGVHHRRHRSTSMPDESENARQATKKAAANKSDTRTHHNTTGTSFSTANSSTSSLNSAHGQSPNILSGDEPTY
jgi:curved DNA-binding protein CbpA